MCTMQVFLLLNYLFVQGDVQELSSSAVLLDRQRILGKNQQTTLFCNSSLKCSESNKSSCSPYFICEEQQCRCRDDYSHGIKCGVTGIEVCVTYSATKELLLSGDCLFNCGNTVVNNIGNFWITSVT